MSALEKVAWLELSLCTITVAIVTALYPWLGNGATGAFGLLGFIACGIFFLKGQGKKVLVDERDREIERLATKRGIEAAWFLLFLSLIAIVIWSSFVNDRVVPSGLLNWLIWVQFAICYGVKGLVAIRLYRRQRIAA